MRLYEAHSPLTSPGAVLGPQSDSFISSTCQVDDLRFSLPRSCGTLRSHDGGEATLRHELQNLAG